MVIVVIGDGNSIEGMRYVCGDGSDGAQQICIIMAIIGYSQYKCGVERQVHLNCGP